MAKCVINGKDYFIGIEIKVPQSCSDYVRVKGKWTFAGREITDVMVLKRLNKLGLPPAWNNVVAAVDPRAKVQAIGKDAAGRWQYRYSVEHVEEASRKKFNRVKLFGDDMSMIRARVKRDIVKGDPRAFLLKIEDRTGIRVGSAMDFRAKKKAYGLTTLQHEHVVIKGDKIVLDFVAKEGIPAHYEYTDKVVARWLAKRKKNTSIGDKLFPDVPAKKLNKYIKQISGGKPYSAKDFRTYHGTRIAFEELGKHAGKTLTKIEKKNVVDKVLKKVSDFLKNTPVMAKKAYIDPMVWDMIGGV